MNTYGNCLQCRSFPKSSFSCLTNEAVSKGIIPHSVSLSFKKGQDIYLEDALSKGVFCVQSGKIKVYKKCSERNLILTLAGNSDLLGFQSLFTNDKYTNSACCLEDSQVCFIPKKDFKTLLNESPELMMNLIKQMSQENQEMSNLIRELKCKNTIGRIASALTKIIGKFGLDENKCLNISMTRKEISELSGTTTESAIRILNDMRRDKVVSFIGNRIKVLDMDKLNRYITG